MVFILLFWQCCLFPSSLFPSSFEAPNMIVTNGMVIPNYSSTKVRFLFLGTCFHTFIIALLLNPLRLWIPFKMIGVRQLAYTNRTMTRCTPSVSPNTDKWLPVLSATLGPRVRGGQGEAWLMLLLAMTNYAGIVHGTTITIMNAARKYCGSNDMKGKVTAKAAWMNPLAFLTTLALCHRWAWGNEWSSAQGCHYCRCRFYHCWGPRYRAYCIQCRHSQSLGSHPC